MSAPSSYSVRFVEWLAMEIVIDEAHNEADALNQARALWDQSSDIAKLRDNGTECWEAHCLDDEADAPVIISNAGEDASCR